MPVRPLANLQNKIFEEGNTFVGDRLPIQAVSFLTDDDVSLWVRTIFPSLQQKFHITNLLRLLAFSLQATLIGKTRPLSPVFIVLT
jgi:hypothetical protein